MNLTVSDGGTTRHPTPDKVSKAIHRIARLPDEFIILERDADTYIQFLGNQLEYRVDGRHFQAVDPNTSAKVAERIFLAYLDNSDPQKAGIEWREIEEAGVKIGGKSLLVGLLVIAALVTGIVCFVMQS